MANGKYYTLKTKILIRKLKALIGRLTIKYRTQGFFAPLNFHEFHELFWIREIKFVKCYSYNGNYNEISVKNAWIVKI